MIHIYCGDGKGKTTAAVGLAVRAAGAGKKVLIYQFLKNGTSAEIAQLQKMNGVTVKSCSACKSFTFRMTEKEKNKVRAEQNNMLLEIYISMNIEKNTVIILDEFFGAYNTGMFDTDLADHIVKDAGKNIELVLTGRKPDKKFIAAADYVSEIKAVSHPFTKGIKARRGIEY